MLNRVAGVLAKLGGDHKMVIIARMDLKMGKGKLAAQCAHAAVSAAEKARVHSKRSHDAWMACGQPKIVVKCRTESHLMELIQEAHDQGLTTAIIRDAGHTQVAVGTRTVGAIGPGPGAAVDRVTGHLKLL